MWRRSRLPKTNRKRRVHRTVGLHVFGEKPFPWNGTQGFNDLRRAEDAFPDQVLDEFFPLTSFHLKHHNKQSRDRLLTHLHLKIGCRIRNSAVSIQERAYQPAQFITVFMITPLLMQTGDLHLDKEVGTALCAVNHLNHRIVM